MSWSENQRSCFTLFIYAAFFGVIFGGLLVASYVKCHAKASKQGLECSYMPLQGCMVKIDGKWIDYDRLRITE